MEEEPENTRAYMDPRVASEESFAHEPHIGQSSGMQPGDPTGTSPGEAHIMGAVQTALHSTKSYANSPASASLLCCAVGVGNLAWSDGIG